MEPARDPFLEALAGAIASEVDALARLRFKFEVQQMLLAGSRATWLEETTRELEEAIARVHEADTAFRAALAEAATRSLGLAPESTLREVAAAVSEPWRYIFGQGRDELRRSVERVGALCAENRKLLARGYLATAQALSLLGMGTTAMAYDSTGAPAPSRLDAAILNAKA